VTTKLVPAKPGGPSKRKPKDGERVALSLRMTPALKRRLDAAAEKGGRSLSQEAEFRLERSFERETLLSETLTVAFGRRLAGLLLAIGLTIRGVANLTQGRRHLLRDDWTEDDGVYSDAVIAIETLLFALRPKFHKFSYSDRGLVAVSELIEALNADDRPDATSAQVEEIKKLLGPIVMRLAEFGHPSTAQNAFELGMAVHEASGELRASTREAKSSRLDVLPPGAVMEILQRHLENYLRSDWRGSEFELASAVCEASRELGKTSRLNACAIAEILQRHLKNYLRPDWLEWWAAYERVPISSGRKELKVEIDLERDAHSRRQRKRAGAVSDKNQA
jgi:hypothetical protein